MRLWSPRTPLRILTCESSLFYASYFFIDDIYLTYFVSISLFQSTRILQKLLYVLIIDMRCWNLYSYITFKCFLILVELITILNDKVLHGPGLSCSFRVASWHIGLGHMQITL